MGSRFAVRIGSIWFLPTTSRIALSATAFDGGVELVVGIFHVEEKRRRVLDHPEDGEIDVDDVFIAGQHQAFFRHVARAFGVAQPISMLS
jgi:hypothetical protein